jgi:hypothetical protein
LILQLFIVAFSYAIAYLQSENLNCNWDSLKNSIFFFIFFLLGKKETKTQDERPTPIFYPSKSLRSAA